MNSNHNKEPQSTIFEDLGFSEGEADNLKARTEMMIAIREYMKKNNLTQKKAAKLFKVDQPQISRLLNGKIQYFTIDKLMVMLARVDIKVEFRIAA